VLFRSFLNGRTLAFGTPLTTKQRSALQQLANSRALPASDINDSLARTLYPLWNSGEVEIKE
jgi:hypothetical protein